MKFKSSIIDVLSSKTRVKIIKFLLTHEASMSEREIASVLEVSHMSINRTMAELSKINLVNYTSVGKVHLWKVNRDSYAYKILHEFIKGTSQLRAPLADLKVTILRNVPKKLIKQVIIYGSIATGKEKVNSDIDVFFMVKDKKDKKKFNSQIERLFNICLEKYGNRFSPYVLTEQEAKSKSRSKLISEIYNGIEIFPKMKEAL